MPNQCKKCGKEIEENLIMCSECEQSSVVNLQAEKPKIKKKISKKKIILLGIVSALVLFFALIMSTPSIVSIEASYEGDTAAGVVLDSNNDGFLVIGTNEDGEKSELSSWKIETPKTLSADSTEKVIITFGDCKDTVEVECSTSKVKELIIDYTGDREEGTIVTKNSAGLVITALHKNGTETDVTDDCELVEDVEFIADKSVEIQVKYIDPIDGEEFTENKTVKCSTVTIESISAKYTGSKAEGTVLDEDNDDIVVTAKYKDGSKEEVKGWKVKEAVSLKADKTSKVVITYEGKNCTLEVTCSTMSKSAYMSKCQTISYNELARNPGKHEGKMVKFTGKVFQVSEGLFSTTYMISVTNKGYGYYDDNVYVTYYGDNEDSRILEDDIVTFYGEYKGLKTYETVMGASRTIPQVTAKYIVLK